MTVTFKKKVELKRKVLRVTAKHFVAGSEWVLQEGSGWVCVRAAPILKWMVGMSPLQAMIVLVRKRYKYEWFVAEARALGMKEAVGLKVDDGMPSA